MIEVIRTNSDNTDFIRLVKILDAYLKELDGEEHAFYNRLNKIDAIKHVIVAYKDHKPVACGAIRESGADAMEVKRMFTLPEERGKGIALKVLQSLETWATELGYKRCVLETGKRQPEAISLYERNGYKRISNYGKYLNIENSVCFEKNLF